MEPITLTITTPLQAIVVADALTFAKKLEAEAARTTADPLERAERLAAFVKHEGHEIRDRALAAAVQRTDALSFFAMSHDEISIRAEQRASGQAEVGLDWKSTIPPMGVSPAEHQRRLKEQLAAKQPAGPTVEEILRGAEPQPAARRDPDRVEVTRPCATSFVTMETIRNAKGKPIYVSDQTAEGPTEAPSGDA